MKMEITNTYKLIWSVKLTLVRNNSNIGSLESRIFLPWTYPPPDNLPSHLGHPPVAVKAKIWKLALTHTLDPNRPMTRGPEPNRPTTYGLYPNHDPNRPTGLEIIWKLALINILKSAINFVRDNGRSFYIVGWRMVYVVEGRNVLHDVKGELFGRRGNVQGIYPGGNVQIPLVELPLLSGDFTRSEHF